MSNQAIRNTQGRISIRGSDKIKGNGKNPKKETIRVTTEHPKSSRSNLADERDELGWLSCNSAPGECSCSVKNSSGKRDVTCEKRLGGGSSRRHDEYRGSLSPLEHEYDRDSYADRHADHRRHDWHHDNGHHDERHYDDRRHDDHHYDGRHHDDWHHENRHHDSERHHDYRHSDVRLSDGRDHFDHHDERHHDDRHHDNRHHNDRHHDDRHHGDRHHDDRHHDDRHHGDRHHDDRHHDVRHHDDRHHDVRHHDDRHHGVMHHDDGHHDRRHHGDRHYDLYHLKSRQKFDLYYRGHQDIHPYEDRHTPDRQHDHYDHLGYDSPGHHHRRHLEHWGESFYSRPPSPHMFHKEALRAHNAKRALHGVAPLKLSSDLNEYAESYAEELARTGIFDHSPCILHGQRIGENLAYRWTSNHADYSVTAAVEGWYNEIQDYDFTKELNSLIKTGHFTQLVWRETTEMGIGKAHDSEGQYYIVASYRPPGNRIGAFYLNVLPPLSSYLH